MSCLALCLFFIAILHNGVLKVAHADETTTEGLSKTHEEEVKTQPIVVEKAKVEDEVSLKLVPQAISAEPVKAEPRKDVETVIHMIAANPIEEKDASNKGVKTEDRFFGPPIHVFKSIPMKHTQFFFEFPSKSVGQSAQNLNVRVELSSQPGVLVTANKGRVTHFIFTPSVH